MTAMATASRRRRDCMKPSSLLTKTPLRHVVRNRPCRSRASGRIHSVDSPRGIVFARIRPNRWRGHHDYLGILKTKAKEGRDRMNRVRFSVAAIGLGLLFCSLPALAQFPGAVTTTTEGGVAQTVFSDKSDVFFTAGPTATPCAAIQFVNDGQYYFQVTDLSGATLLSSDPVSERLVTVHGGVLATYNGHTHDTNGADVPAEESSEESELAPFRGPCGALSVRLAPFRDAGSREASYLLWVTPVARFTGDP